VEEVGRVWKGEVERWVACTLHEGWVGRNLLEEGFGIKGK
jgi:hypothetical protein